MGTSNFHNKNASNIFAVLMSYENDEGETIQCDEFDYEWFLDAINETLHTEAKKHNLTYIEKDKDDPYALRSYPSKIIGSLFAETKILEIAFEVEIKIIIRSGYYEGANLDWEITTHINGNECEEPTETDIWNELAYYSRFNRGLCKIHSKKGCNWFESEKQKLITLVENIYTQHSTPMGIVAKFSNGETIYSKI